MAVENGSTDRERKSEAKRGSKDVTNFKFSLYILATNIGYYSYKRLK
jgi:hypothetical protein